MKLYDEVITQILSMVEESQVRNLAIQETSWPQVSDRSMILRSDMAFELGAELKQGIGCTLVTGNQDLVSQDEILLIGKDLSELKQGTSYARIAIIEVDEAVMGEGEALYNAIQKLNFVRYHFYPEGFMNRISSTKHKETVRVSKDALAKGLNFTIVGNEMIRQFKENPRVKHVKLIYITDDSFDYRQLLKLSLDSEDITKTIDHIFKNVIMDCKACNLQKVCDEVEGLKQLHFGQNNQPS